MEITYEANSWVNAMLTNTRLRHSTIAAVMKVLMALRDDRSEKSCLVYLAMSRNEIPKRPTTTAEEKKGSELSTTNLSNAELMLATKAAPRVRRTPLSASRFLNGASRSDRDGGRLRKYDPLTTNKIPRAP